MIGIIRVGDKTTGGGEVLSGSENIIFGGIPIARIGDPISCPLPGHEPAYISEGHPKMHDQDIGIAFHGYKCSCGCLLISSLASASASA